LRLFAWARAVFFSLRFIGWACGLWGWVSKRTRRWGAVDGQLCLEEGSAEVRLGEGHRFCRRSIVSLAWYISL